MTQIRLSEKFPPYSEVWHKASGEKGIVQGWTVLSDMSETVRVDYGEGCNFRDELPGCLQTTDPEKEYSNP